MSCVLLALLISLGQLPSTPLRFAETTVELGELNGGAPARATFRYTNAGNETVELLEVTRSCGCTAPRWDRVLLRPGETGVLTFDLRTLGQPEGPRTWTAELHYRAGSAMYRQMLAIRATLRNELVLTPPQLAFHVLRGAEQEIVLEDRRESPLRLVGWRTQAPGVSVAVEQLAPGRFRMKLTVDATKLVAGRHDHVLHLATDDPRYADLEVPLTLVREEERPVRWSPEVPDVILAPGQNRASTLVRLQSAAGTPVTIQSAEPSEPGLACTWAAANDGSVTVRVSVDRATYRARSLQAAVRLQTSAGPVGIPVLVRIE